MSDLQISGHKCAIMVDKSTLLHLFPNSLFGVILEQDPSATEIKLTNPCVTSHILRAIRYMVNRQRLPKVSPGVDYITAGRYLLMDIFNVIADPHLSYILDYSSVSNQDYLDDQLLLRHYEQHMRPAMYKGALSVAQYICDRVPSEQTQEIDEEMFKDSITYDHPEFTRLFLRRGIDPSISNNYAIGASSESGRTELVQLLLKDSRVNPDNGSNYPFIAACRNGHLEVAKLLLADPRVDPTAQDNHALREAKRNNHPEIIKLLEADPRISEPAARDEDIDGIKRPSFSFDIETYSGNYLYPMRDSHWMHGLQMEQKLLVESEMGVLLEDTKNEQTNQAETREPPEEVRVVSSNQFKNKYGNRLVSTLD